jgi:hypothetical protein
MALGLASLGEGRNRSLARGSATLLHLAAGALGGAVMALAVWLALTPARTLFPGPTARLLVAGALALFLIGDVRGKPLREKSQVPQQWLPRYGPSRAFAAYGAILGFGLFTPIPSFVVYSVFLVGGLDKHLAVPVLAGGLFGFARSLAVGVTAFAAGPTSRVLFRSSRSSWLVRKVGAVVGLVLLLTTASMLRS